jgi:hypothetical protein
MFIFWYLLLLVGSYENLQEDHPAIRRVTVFFYETYCLLATHFNHFLKVKDRLKPVTFKWMPNLEFPDFNTGTEFESFRTTLAKWKNL